MKKFNLVSVIVLTGMMLVSCSFGGKSIKNPNGRIAVELSEAEVYANEAPKGVLRAAGEATGAEQGWATREATAMARANLAEQISTKIISGVEMYRNSYTKAAIAKDAVSMVRDSEGGERQSILQVCEQMISGARPVKISTFMLPNGAYQVFVCVEADVETVSQYISDSEEVKQLISDGEREKIEYNRDQFKKRLDEALSR